MNCDCCRVYGPSKKYLTPAEAKLLAEEWIKTIDLTKLIESMKTKDE